MFNHINHPKILSLNQFVIISQPPDWQKEEEVWQYQILAAMWSPGNHQAHLMEKQIGTFTLKNNLVLPDKGKSAQIYITHQYTIWILF